MSKVCQISVLCKVAGNVNADWTVGQRITLKKMQTAEGEVKPFISARAIKYAIRKALQERGHGIDQFKPLKEGGRIQLTDTGNPIELTDNDIFGFMTVIEKGKKKGEGADKEEKGQASKRQAPIALSYLRALRGVPISTDLGLRSPRKPDQSPLPFETEVAEFIGKLDCLIYDYIGIYQGTEKVGDSFAKKGEKFIDDDKRRKRLHDFLDIFLPRGTNSLQIPEYFIALVMLSSAGPKPIYQYLDYELDERGKVVVDTKLLKTLVERVQKWNKGADPPTHRLVIVKYRDDVIPEELTKLGIEVTKPEEVIDEIVKFMIG